MAVPGSEVLCRQDVSGSPVNLRSLWASGSPPKPITFCFTGKGRQQPCWWEHTQLYGFAHSCTPFKI